jgi:hypothetical protein
MGKIEESGKAIRYFTSPHAIFASAIVFPFLLLMTLFYTKLDLANPPLNVISYVLIIIPCISFIAYLYMLIFMYNRIYAPSQFKNEDNFMKLQGRINALEEIPMVQYATKLTGIGKRLILGAYREPQELTEFHDEFKEKHNRTEIDIQVDILKKIGWLEQLGDVVKITAKGRKDLQTFLDFVYSRIAPADWGE